MAVLAVTGLCALGYNAVGFEVPAVAYLFAVYAAVRSGHRIITLVASVALLVTLPLAVMASPGDGPAGDAFVQARGVLELAWLIAAGAAGEALWQAERRANEAERTREETARLRATEERLHIARELHDSLTHQISIVKVQAEVAVHLARKRGEQVPEALLAIQQAGRYGVGTPRVIRALAVSRTRRVALAFDVKDRHVSLRAPRLCAGGSVHGSPALARTRCHVVVGAPERD